MDMADIAVDPHYAAREAIVDVESTPDAGTDRQAVGHARRLRWPGRALDADGDAIRRDGWG